MSHFKTKILVGGLLLLTALLFIAFPTRADSLQIIWSPPKISETVVPGEAKAITVTLTASKNIRRAAIEVSAQLASFVKPEPAAFERIGKGQRREVRLIL